MKRKFYLKIIAIAAMLCTHALFSFGQKGYFQPVTSVGLRGAPLTITADPKISNIKNVAYLQLNQQALSNYLMQAPMEFKNNGVTLPLEIPLPNGMIESFNMVESPVLSTQQAALHPEIKTYAGSGTANKNAVIRLSLTSSGFNAIILNVGGDAVYFEKSKTGPDTYFSYLSRDASLPFSDKGNNLHCGTIDSAKAPLKNGRSSTTLSSGSILYTFRIAVAANGEFTANYGGTVTDGYNAVVGYVNRMKAVFRNELSVDFSLVSGTNLVYNNAFTDPYTNTDDGAMLHENQANLDAIIGNGNYDIGHVLGAEPNGSSAGGVASGHVCDDTYKGQGVSKEGDIMSYSQLFSDQVLFHETGHQFGMAHTYNASGFCNTRSQATSVEPGSGATIMSYGFICGLNYDYFSTTQTGLFLNFHSVSYQQAMNLIGTLSCYASPPPVTGNTPPVITMPPAYTVPRSTPFALTGSATDAESNPLTYSWEGTNLGSEEPNPPTVTTLDDPSQSPWFRSYEPTTSATRVYPLLSAILSGVNQAKGDKLPSISVVTTHTLTVRDNNPAGGGVSVGTVNVTVNAAIGPFLETTNLTGNHEAGTSQIITWDVKGTDTATPNVKISLSTDGGSTFPTVLAASTPNDGSESIMLPNITTSVARIKVEAVDNIFFDISNSNFTIQPFAPCAIAGTVSGPLTRYTSQLGTYTETGGTDGVFEWRSAAVSGGPYTEIPGATSNPASFAFAAPGTYYVVLARKVGVCADALSNELTVVVTIQGDLPCNAIPVAVGNNGPYSNVGANVDAGEVTAPAGSCYVQTGWCTATIAHTIWAKFTAPASGKVSIATPGFDTKVALYSVSDCANYATYTLIAANDDGGAGNSGMITAACLTPGIVYYIQINGYENEVGLAFINIVERVKTAPIMAHARANGIISPDGTTVLGCGSSQIYTITPNAGYVIQSVLIDGVSHAISGGQVMRTSAVQASATYTFTSVVDPHTIEAIFSTALPVTLAYFNATLKGRNNARLAWKTASETNNAGFDIEMSTDAKAFVKVGFVDGNGDSKETNQYTYTVSDLAGGNYYFRLKQLDHDGKFEYSTIRNLEIVNADDMVSVYPNPTSGKLKFNPGNYRSETFGIRILNQAGLEVMSLPAGSKYSQGFELDVTGLPTGFYNISIQGSSFTETLKFVKM